MEFKYENKGNLFLVIFLFGVSAYILSKRVIMSIAIIIAILIIYLFIGRRKVRFTDENIIVNSSIISRNNFTVLYSQIADVYFDQIYTTLYLNIIVTITFDINGKELKTKFDVDKHYRASELYKLLSDKKIKCRFSDDYLETLIIGGSHHEK